jgi:predicted amidohydrolase YtcJ
MVTGCGSGTENSSSDSSNNSSEQQTQSAKHTDEPADRIFVGGNIVTAKPNRPEVEALAVRDGRVARVGDREPVNQLKGPKTEVVQLNGRALMPGFIDPHTHPISRQITETMLDVGPFTHKSFEAVKQTLREAARKGPVVAFGYDPSLMDGNPQLGFETLNKISTEVPILVVNLSGHIAYGNRLFFKKSGITEETPNPEGGRFVRDDQGNLTGVAHEVSAILPLIKTAGELSGKLDFTEVTRESLQNYARNGFTTMTIPGLGMPAPTPEKQIANLRQAARSEKAPIRVQGYVISTERKRINELRQDNDDRFRVLGMKLWADGSTQGYTAALEEPYKGKDTRGTANYSQEQLTKLIVSAHKNGWQVATHTNGDRAMDMALNAYAKAQKQKKRPDARHRMEHCTVGNRDLMHRAVNLGVTCSFLNQHVYIWGEKFRDEILGQDRASHLDPAGTAERLGMRFTFHDDAPTGQPEPMLMLQTAVRRQIRDGGVLNADERVPIDRAIRALTIDAAWQTHFEDKVGSLEKGKYADLVLLDSNPRKTDPDKIKDIEVLGTYLAGRRVDQK